MPRWPAKHDGDPVDQSQAYSANFSTARKAFAHLEMRGYRLTSNSNWLPPAHVEAPTQIDLEAALLLTHAADYGGIIKMLSCPFCGGKANAFSPVGVECMDCGGTAESVEAWQKRI